MIGFDYLYHGLSFDSYYFANGYSTWYDRNFAYSHSLTRHELQLPLLLKVNLGREDRDAFIFYFTAGWAYRLLLLSRSSITAKSNGANLWNGNSPSVFEHPFISKQGSGVLQASFGGQLHNIRIEDGPVFFAEMCYKYGASRFSYTGNGTSNNFFIKDSQFLISVGFGF